MPASNRVWKPFIIPQHVLKTPYLTSSLILHLPIEILCLIFQHADLLGQFALALSCKPLLQASTLITFKSSVFVNHLVSSQSFIMEQLLRLLKPLTATGRPKQTWKLCVDCLQYRPRRKSYWEKKDYISEDVTADWAIGNWIGGGSSMQCPECKCWEREEMLKACRLARERTGYNVALL